MSMLYIPICFKNAQHGRKSSEHYYIVVKRCKLFVCICRIYWGLGLKTLNLLCDLETHDVPNNVDTVITCDRMFGSLFTSQVEIIWTCFSDLYFYDFNPGIALFITHMHTIELIKTIFW